MLEGEKKFGGPDSIRDLDADRWNPQEILGEADLDHSIPLRALLLSFAALLVPIVTAVFFPTFASADTGLLIWLTALLPGFLLTYYRGWSGASLALAMGMAALALSQVALLLAGIRATNWILLGASVFIYVAMTLGIGWLTELLQVERQAAERMALTDTLTKMPNRRHAVVFIERAFAAAQRGIPLTVVLFDADKFKRYNDTRGHLAGDEALKRLAKVLLASTRSMNLTARWGGEEFLALLADTPRDGGLIYAERVLADVHTEFPDGSLTLSAGLASFEKGMDSPARLLAVADEAMYEAKAAGGDCVRMASWTPEKEGGS
jgi:diguanylate cyclase (GGDEF)-like protein